MGRRLVAAGREAGPVVEVDQADRPVVGHDAVAAVDVDVEDARGLVADALQLVEVEGDAFRRAVDLLEAKLAVVHVRGVEPVEEVGPRHAIELHQVADEVLVDHGAGDAADGVFLQDAAGLLGVADVGDVLAVDGVEVAPLDPAVVEAHLGEGRRRVLGGLEDQAARVGDMVVEEETGHALAGTVLDAVAGVDDERPAVFQLLEAVDRAPVADHVEDHPFLEVVQQEVRFDVFIDDSPSFSQMFGCQGEDGGVVADMVRRELVASSYARDNHFIHAMLFLL